MTASAQAGWAALMGAGGAQDRAPGETRPADLDPPAGLVATGGRGQITLHWNPVPGAIGYAIHRATTPDGPYTVVDHGGGDVLAVPHGPYADTTINPGTTYWYAVAPLATVTTIGPLSAPARAATTAGGGAVTVTVDTNGDTGPLPRIWQAMVGSEHLSHLLETATTGGHPIGTDLHQALRRIHDELGVRTVRAHGILDDDLGTYRLTDGTPHYDFTGIDRVYDTLLTLGLHPVVELGFMPHDLATNPTHTVFTYRGIISPPHDWDRWAELIRTLTRHLLDRYGRDQVVNNWNFEVWNEANLSVFWTGTPAEYWQLYDTTARAIKEVDPDLRVGGPATAAVGWIDDQTTHHTDFLSTHVYGTPPLDLRPLADGRPLLWTEWGVTATHGHPINDTVFAATFLLRGMRSAAGRIDALAPWVASDHFEELGRPQRLLHGGFGLLTVGNLAKPKYWALTLAQRLGETTLPTTLTGDGADSLVEAWAARTADGTTTTLLWNGTLDQSKMHGSTDLNRTVTIRYSGLTPGPHTLRTWRIDTDHANLSTHWTTLAGDADWPTDEQWQTLKAADHLDEAEPPQTLTAEPDGTAEVTLELPMPAIAHLELSPA